MLTIGRSLPLKLTIRQHLPKLEFSLSAIRIAKHPKPVVHLVCAVSRSVPLQKPGLQPSLFGSAEKSDLGQQVSEPLLWRQFISDGLIASSTLGLQIGEIPTASLARTRKTVSDRQHCSGSWFAWVRLARSDTADHASATVPVEHSATRPL
jgi:hypothetical protein